MKVLLSRRIIKMTKMIKKTIAVVLCVIMMIGIAPLNGFMGLEFPELHLPDFGSIFETKASAASSGTCGENLTWSYSGKTLTISGSGDMNSYNDCYDAYIGSFVTNAPWKSYCKEMRSVVVNYGVTSIGNYAFEYCTGLTSITIPESVTKIGSYAFYCCNGLTSITIPDSVTFIGGRAFAGTENVVYNGNASGSPWDANIVNGYVESPLVYEDNTKTKICACYSNATGSLIIPNGVTEIGYSAFGGCTGLTSITIPESVTNIGGEAFVNCAGLSEVIYKGSIADWCRINFHSNPLQYAHKLYINDAELTNISKEDLFGITTIGDYTFYGYTGLTSITIPEDVTSIGVCAFCNCTGLTSITIPDSVTSIGNSAFWGCTGLTSIIIPESVIQINEYAFNKCDSIVDVYYVGSRENWNNINIKSNNSVLENAVDYSEYDGDTSHAWIHFSKDYNINYYDGEELVKTITLKNLSRIPDYIPQKIGYSFTDWQWKTENGKKPSYMPENNLEAFAKWQINQHTISFDSNGGTEIDNITMCYGDEIIKPENPNKKGYSFAGWKPEIPETMPDEDIIVTAKWTPNQYAITFNTDGGTPETEPITADYGAEIDYYIPEETVLIDPSKVAYPESPHNYLNNMDQTYYFTYPGASSLKITFSWECQFETSFKDYLVIYDGLGNQISKNCGYALQNKVLTIDGDSFSLQLVSNRSNTYYGFSIDSIYATVPRHHRVKEPHKEGYTFLGWDKEFPATMPAENTTITALWSINEHTITFDSNGGSNVESITQNYGTEIVKPADPTRTGFTFAGWDINVPGTMPDEDLTLTAQWTRNIYTITYLDDDGSVLETCEYYYGYSTDYSYYSPAYKPYREGYTFCGWDAEIPETMPARDLTFTAIWTINSYTLTFVFGNGTDNLEITQYYNTPITAPDYPTRKGYTFTGWNQTVPELMPGYDMTITARWSINRYTITYYDQLGDSVLDTESYNYGSTVYAPGSYYKSGYMLKGWVWPDGKDAKPDTMPAYNIKAYAIWVTDDGAHSGHDIRIVGSVAPTCTKDGFSGRSFCNTCNKGIDNGYTLPAYGHDYVKTIQKEETCTQTGIRTCVCNFCGKKTEETIPATGHSRTSEEITKQPTCTGTGIRTITCHCGYSWTESVPANGHNYDDVLDYAAASCGQEGYVIKKCTECDSTTRETIKALEHNYVTEPAVDATCTQDGHSLKKYCKLCGTVEIEPTVTPALGHNYEKQVITEAECGKDGTYKMKCTRCNQIEKDESGENDKIYIEPAPDHDYEEITIKEATCQEKGQYVKKCKRCGEYLRDDTPSYKSVVADASLYPETPHNYENLQEYNYVFSYPNTKEITIVFSADCMFETDYDFVYLYDAVGNEQGRYTGNQLQGKTITLSGDSFTIKVSTDRTTNYYGLSVDSITCLTDISVKKFDSPLSSHSFTEAVAKPATPLEEGQLTCICKYCGYSETRVIPRTIYAVGEVISYGSYPQSKVTDKNLLNQLNAQNAVWHSFGYYGGTGNINDGGMEPMDFMRYTDVTYNGVKYRGVTFSKYRTVASGGVPATMGNYSLQDDYGYYSNRVYWFRYDPLQWRILDPTKGLVVCENAIDSQPYNNYIYRSSSEYYGNSSYANNWVYSSIREWLNNDFINTAFTDAQKQNILSTENCNLNYKSLTGETKTHKYDSADTVDKIFLLSYDEALNWVDYGFSISTDASETRVAYSTDYAKCNGVGLNARQEVCWSLRTSGNRSDRICLVRPDGSIYTDYSGSESFVGTTVMGIRPALRLGNISATGGESSSDQLYTVTYQIGDNTLGMLHIGLGDPIVLLDTSAPAGYAFSGWSEPDQMPGKNITLTGEYLPIYKATFKADGVTVGTVDYTTASTAIIEPAVPEKEGYIGHWEEYSFTAGGITVNAVYEKESEHVHKYSEFISKQPTCTEKGEKTFACDCGDSYTTEIPALGHSFTSYMYNNDATAEKDGTETQICSVCGEKGETRIKEGTKLPGGNTDNLDTAKANAKKEIDNNIPENASEAVRKAAEDAKAAIDSAATTNAVNTAKQNGIEAINNQIKKEQENANNDKALADSKTAAKAEIDKAVPSDASDAVKALAKTAKQNIDKATDTDGVIEAKYNGLYSIKEQLAKENTPDNPDNPGEDTTLTELKTAAKAVIDSAAEGKSDAVKALAKTAKQNIDKATDVDGVSTAKTNGISAINAQIKKEQDEKAAKELADAKSAAKAEIDKAVPAGASDAVKKIASDAKAKIDKATSVDAVNTEKTSAINSVKNKIAEENKKPDESKIKVSAPSGTRTDIKYNQPAKIIASATGLPKGYKLAIYEGNSQKKSVTANDAGEAAVEFETGALTSDRTFTVKVLDTSGKEVDGKSKTVTIDINDGFFQKIISFFLKLFGALKQVDIKP